MTLRLEDMTTVDHETLVGALRCATIGHAWFDVDSTWKPNMGVPLTVRCERCGRERRDTLDVHGEVLNRDYWPRKSWLRYPKHQRPSRAEFRQLLLKQRMLEAREARKMAVSA